MFSDGVAENFSPPHFSLESRQEFKHAWIDVLELYINDARTSLRMLLYDNSILISSQPNKLSFDEK